MALSVVVTIPQAEAVWSQLPNAQELELFKRMNLARDWVFGDLFEIRTGKDLKCDRNDNNSYTVYFDDELELVEWKLKWL